ncbi:MAG TPA: YkgJ family cysteine cluster protein [Gemmataceae bacterium]|nr:YkgJ family cysteine cluster protein [Gemmataceae bacterium]
MPLPVRHLSVLQNWDCQGCGNCCREYHISVTEEERQHILTQGWEQDPAIGTFPLFVRSGPPWSRKYRLNHRSDGACIFLSSENRCKIHERFGEAAKPFPCRLYPFVLVPVGDHFRAGLRFACPSAAANRGKRLADHYGHLTGLVPELEMAVSAPGEQIPAPPLQRGQQINWPDLLRFVDAIQTLLRDRSCSFEGRMRKCLALTKLCRQARFEKIKGSRLVEFLSLVGMSLEKDVPSDPLVLPAPGRLGRVLFRQALAVYIRKDQGPQRNEIRSKLGLVRAAWRFARGKGPVPRLHGWLPQTTFERVEEPRGVLSQQADAILERYYLVKVGSLQFCGPAFYRYTFWEGLESLALTLPIILWITRAMGDISPEEAAQRAIAMVDRNFGFNPVLGMQRQRLAIRILSHRGELERLIAWYSR